jgi:hypothetical protein
MKNVFLYFIKAIAALYFVIFIVAEIDILLAMLNGEPEGLVLGFTADLSSLFFSAIVIIGLGFIISVPVKQKPTN